MTDTFTPQGPFMNSLVFDASFGNTQDTIARITTSTNRPDGALVAVNPLIIPEPKYCRLDSAGSIIDSLRRFQEEVVCWAAAIGDPDDKFLTTAMSKAWLSWVFGCDSHLVPAWALPFDVTRYAGGVARVVGPVRLASAYSGAQEMDDREIAFEFVDAVAHWSVELRTKLLGGHPEINFLSREVADKIDYPILPEGRSVTHITDRVKAVEVTLEAIAA